MEWFNEASACLQSNRKPLKTADAQRERSLVTGGYPPMKKEPFPGPSSRRFDGQSLAFLFHRGFSGLESDLGVLTVRMRLSLSQDAADFPASGLLSTLPRPKHIDCECNRLIAAVETRCMILPGNAHKIKTPSDVTFLLRDFAVACRAFCLHWDVAREQ